MLYSSFPFYTALISPEYIVFVIDKSFIIYSHKSSSCSDNDEFYLDF